MYEKWHMLCTGTYLSTGECMRLIQNVQLLSHNVPLLHIGPMVSCKSENWWWRQVWFILLSLSYDFLKLERVVALHKTNQSVNQYTQKLMELRSMSSPALSLEFFHPLFKNTFLLAGCVLLMSTMARISCPTTSLNSPIFRLGKEGGRTKTEL